LPPIGKKAGVLTGRHGPTRSTASSEQVLTRLLAGCLKEVVNGLAGLISQLELHRSPSLLLPDDRAIDCITIWGNIFDLQGYDIATTQLAEDGKIEQGKVSGPLFDQ
jgi:hypothetical protein